MEKRILLWMALMALFMGKASAATFTVDDFEIAANETKEISINLTNTETIYGYVLWLQLPEGITIESDEYGAIVSPTSRFNNAPQINFSQGYYKITAATGGRPVSGNSGAILTFNITASDQISTGSQSMEIAHQQITVNNEQGNAVTVDQESSTYTCTTRVDAKIAASGYGSFSWPRALDFSACEGLEKVFIGGEDANGKLSLVEVASKQVPAATGVVLKGTTGVVNPSTMEAEPAGDQGTLTPTCTGTYEVTADNTIYVLKTGGKGTGFYPCQTGVVVPQYKVYLERDASQGANMISMEEEGTTSIDGVAATDSATEAVYTVSGVRVAKPTRKGIYVSEGKKVVIK